MKGLSVNKMLGSLKRRAGGLAGSDGPATPPPAATPADQPEATAHNSVKAFCEAGGSVHGDEVLFLPPIVDAAESSPAAAAECARIIRRYLGKDYYSRPSWQYNALMLVRILADNPGPTFTRNLDAGFVDTARALLKGTKDHGLRQLLMETLDDFEHAKTDENLAPLVAMWRQGKEKALKDSGGRMPPPVAPRPPAKHSSYFAKAHSNNRLPEPAELATRLEEARTSAKLLEQVVMNTPPAEMLDNDLIKEFANRCLSASRSIQAYMVADSPAPDNDTMESLIDTNEQLQAALSQHQRAVLSARKQLGDAPNGAAPPPAPPADAKGKAAAYAPASGSGPAPDPDARLREPFHPGPAPAEPDGAGSSRRPDD